MPRKYDTAEEREAARKASRKTYRDKPGVRERERARSRIYMQKKRKLGADAEADVDGTALTPDSGSASPSVLASLLSPEDLVGKLAAGHPPVLLPPLSLSAYEDTNRRAEDLLWQTFEPTPQSVLWSMRCQGERAASDTEMFIGHITGRLARIQSVKHDDRVAAVEGISCGAGTVEELSWAWREELADAELKRQRMVGITVPAALEGSVYGRVVEILKDWAGRDVLYLADALYSLEQGVEGFGEKTATSQHLASRIVRSE